MKAIHDLEYATPPATFVEFRWRLQYLAELGLGRLMRRAYQSEDEAADAMLRRMG